MYFKYDEFKYISRYYYVDPNYVTSCHGNFTSDNKAKGSYVY